MWWKYATALTALARTSTIDSVMATAGASPGSPEMESSVERANAIVPRNTDSVTFVLSSRTHRRTRRGENWADATCRATSIIENAIVIVVTSAVSSPISTSLASETDPR